MLPIVALVICVLNAVALWHLLPRMGFSKWLALPGFFPIVTFVLLWLMALRSGEGNTGWRG